MAKLSKSKSFVVTPWSIGEGRFAQYQFNGQLLPLESSDCWGVAHAPRSSVEEDPNGRGGRWFNSSRGAWKHSCFQIWKIGEWLASRFEIGRR